MQTFLKTQCRSDLNKELCDVGNICYLFTQIIGFAAILPQIHQIWMYQSVDALHVLWPTTLVTASLTQAFFVFAVERRTFFKISAVYFPVIYMIFLIEFWMFSKKNGQKKLLYAALCMIIWASILTLELTVSFPDGASKLEWITVVVYSIKIFPQLMLNIFLRTTFGQSSISVVLYCLLSTFGYVFACLLEVPLETQIMHYMASSLAYINAIQVIWYPKPVFPKKKKNTYGTINDSQDYSVPFEDRNFVYNTNYEENVELQSTQKDVEKEEYDIDAILKVYSSKETSCGSSLGRSQTINIIGYCHRLKEKTCIEIILLIYLISCLIAFTVGLSIRTNTFWTIFGPVSMLLILFITSLYRDYQEGSLSCDFFSEIHYRVFGNSM